MTAILDRRTRICIALIQGGIECDVQVASAGGLHPHKHPQEVEFVRRLRAELRETIDLQYRVFCHHHRAWIEFVPCLACNDPALGDLPPSYEVRGPHWERARELMAAKQPALMSELEEREKRWKKSKP